MTEAEWLACTEADWMVSHVRDRTSDRKRRLFACACCRLIWHLLVDERSRRAVEAVERFADDPNAHADAIQAEREARKAFHDIAGGERGPAHLKAAQAAANCYRRAANATRDVVSLVAEALDPVEPGKCGLPRRQPGPFADLARDVFGPLAYRPVVVDPTWRAWDNGSVQKLAARVYRGREFDQLPFLAELLTEAGCTDEDILDHCRSEGPHVRGCWVIDLLMGKD